MIFLATIFSLIFTIFYLLPSPKPYAGVYNRPDKWFYFKATFIYCMIRLRKFLASRKSKGSLPASIERNSSQQERREGGGYGVKSNDNIASMEQTNQLSDHPLAIDAVLLSCGGKDGSYLVSAIARRKLKMNNTIFCLRIPEVGVLMHPKHPDTTMFTDTEEFWDSEGLQMKMLEPMKRWALSYNGEMVHQTTGQKFNVILQGEYKSELSYFDFDSDMDPWTIARAFAKESWSREYFDKIKSAHQAHYEQFGDLHGNVSINGTSYKLDLNVMRDHTHGSVRDWRLMHRYGIQNFTTINGFRGFIGVVCQPSTFSSLELGYVYTPQGQCLPVQEVDLPLWRHGEGGIHPTDFGFKFKAGDIWHDIQVRVLDSVEVFMGWEWESRIIERFCKYEVDGVPGWGVSEWQYRNHGGRPSSYADKDPQYVKNESKYGEIAL